MPKLPRVTAKIFASNASADDIGQYGSALTGTKVTTSDISEIQALPAYEEGWRGAVISNRNYPTLQEMNGLQKTFSQQIAYCLQNGIPEWDEGTEYFANTSFCQVNGVWYQSLTDNNIGNNPTEDSTKWQQVNMGGDTMPLGYSSYQPAGVQASAAWLASNGQWNSGEIYETFYNHYTPLIGQAFGQGYIRNHTEEYDDYDLVINQTDMTFRLPLLDGSENLWSSKFENFQLNTSNTAGLQSFTAPANGWFILNAAGTDIRMNNTDSGGGFILGLSSGQEFIYQLNLFVPKGNSCNVRYSKLSVVSAFRFIHARGNGTLYYKVGNAVQNQELIDVGEITNSLATKVNMAQAASASMPNPDNYIDLTFTPNTTYTAPADGYYYYARLSSAAGQGISIIVGTSSGAVGYGIEYSSLGAGQNMKYTISIGKGERCSFSSVTLAGSGEVFRFIYAKGAE